MASQSRFVAAIRRASVREVAGAAQPLEFPLLQHAQQLGLQFERDFADLVEKACRRLASSNRPTRLRDGAGEGALLVPEQFAFEQPRGNRRAIQFDERPFRLRELRL